MVQAQPAGSAPTDVVHSAWLEGRYVDCVSLLLSQPRSAERDIFLAQVYQRQNRYRDVLVLLSDAQASQLFSTPELSARAHAKIATAHAVLGDPKQAQSELSLIDRRVEFAPLASIQIEYDVTFASWTSGDYTTAGELIARNLMPERASIDPVRTAGFMMLRSWLSAAKGKYRDQAADLLDAIRRLLRIENTDVGMLASAAHALAGLARDIALPDAIPLLTSVERGTRWPQDLALQRYQTVRALAWAAAVNGQYINAFRELNRAERLSQSDVCQAWSHLDRCNVALISGQEYVANAELQDALQLIRSFERGEASSEEAVTLLMAAELLAPKDATAALQLVDDAENLHRSMSRNLAYSHGRRFEALVNYARASAQHVLGANAEAERSGQIAFEIFTSLEYNWRAAQAALLMYNITQDARWLQRAQEFSAEYPRSFIATTVQAAAKATNLPAGLTERQVEILEQLKEGKRTEDVGQELGISPNTVRIHIGKIHRMLGVKSRAQLLAKVSDLTLRSFDTRASLAAQDDNIAQGDILKLKRGASRTIAQLRVHMAPTEEPVYAIA